MTFRDTARFRTGTEASGPPNELDQLSINTMRTLAMDAVQQANSGQ